MSALRDALANLPDAVFADLLEGENDYCLILDLPGVTEDTLDVRVDGGRLVVEARREKDVSAEFTYRSEDRSLFLDVTLPLPPDVAEATGASIERGVLEVRLPKRRSGGYQVPVEG